MSRTMNSSLKGITWNHSRGITPLQAVSQRYAELHPGVEITWSKRTLQEFADFPIEKLTETYDLLVIDHPWVGRAAATGCVLPLNEILPEGYLAGLAENSAGGAHQSYTYAGKQWALAIDAAAPVASYRKDLLERHGRAVPAAWDDLIVLAKDGKVALPAIPIDTLMNFYAFCLVHGDSLFKNPEEFVARENGVQALMTMKELYRLLDKSMFSLNPVAVAETMAGTDRYLYCPFAYGYSNYARAGYAAHLLHYTDVVTFHNKPLRTTIGGTGLAVSAHSRHQETAVDFARFAASGNCQKTLYVQHGGQPGHRSAWVDGLANQLTNGYFRDTLATLENGYIRPRYNGYLYFQDHAAHPLWQCLSDDTDEERTLDIMNQIYRKSRPAELPASSI